MSWKTLNEILSLATIDPDFCQELLANPLITTQRYGFRLTEHERQVMSRMQATDLAKLSQFLLKQLASEEG